MIAWREGSLPFHVAGESNYQAALEAVTGGYKRVGHDHGCVADLVPEPTNRYDPAAIRVVISGRTVGYVPRTATERLHRAIAEHGPLSCRATITGGWRTNQYDQGHFGVRLAIPGRGPINVV